MELIVIECTYSGSDSKSVHTVGVIVIDCTYSESDNGSI